MFALYEPANARSFPKKRTPTLDFVFGKSEQDGMTITAYRTLKGLSLASFGAMIGRSKGHLHEIERTNRCSAELAMEIERVTEGAVDAASLNDAIADARKAAA